MSLNTDLLEALPVAAYTTDSEGWLTYYNDAAATFWGYRPELGTAQWCGSRRVFWPDGRPMAHDQTALAVTLKEGRPVRDEEAIVERPDGTRIPFVAYPNLLKNSSGKVVGAINLLIDIAERRHTRMELARLAAIVSSSDDAIVSKTLDGQITSWNAGATRIFGYTPDEIIGEHITRIIPPELHQEEEGILRRLRRGERIDHFDTVRLTKDGRRLDVSLTISPLKDRSGKIFGASKVARDVTERKEHERTQALLIAELNHRIKNTLATVQAIANQSLRQAASPEEFTASFSGRMRALARAHDILVQERMKGADLAALVHEQVALDESDGGGRVSISGPRVILPPRIAVQLALVLHELATNARKYGGLFMPEGSLSIEWQVNTQDGRHLLLTWTESGVPDVRAPTSRGFGTTVIERSLGSYGGTVEAEYKEGGLACAIELPLPEEDANACRAGGDGSEHADRSTSGPSRPPDLSGRRILLIEDEAIIAMDTMAELQALGCETLGPAATIDEAMRLVANSEFDAALVDANLNGEPVHQVAAALTRRGIPFAFATGYGSSGLPVEFRDEPILNKPFNARQLQTMLHALLSVGKASVG